MNEPTKVATASIQDTPARNSDPATALTASKSATLDQHLTVIKTLGELLDDLELTRIANGNRISAVERDYGESLPHLDVVQKQLKAIEHLAELELIRAWRKHPLAPWAKQQSGVGEKSIARLVAIIGNPAERENVAKLWAYCGHGDPNRRPIKGMSQTEMFKLGNPRAKKQVWLIATAILKAGVRKAETEPDGVAPRVALTPQAQIYLDARQHVTERLHNKTCVRCGPSGHPAAPGTPWSPAHQHAHALRLTGKAFLKDLWLASRHSSPDTHVMVA